MACRCWNGNEMNGRWGVSALRIEIQWQKWPKLSKALLPVPASQALPRFLSFFLRMYLSLFLSFFSSLPHLPFSLPPSLSSLEWFFKIKSHKSPFFRTAAWCFLHMRRYRSNRAIILPPCCLIWIVLHEFDTTRETWDISLILCTCSD